MKSIRKVSIHYLITAICLTAFAATPCRAAVDTLEVGAVGLVNLTMPRVSNNGVATTGYSALAAIGGGAFVTFPFFPAFRIEGGLFYVPESYSSLSLNKNFNELQVPVLVRFTLIPFLSVGVGGFAGFGIGNVTTSFVNASSTSTPSSTTFAQNSLGTFDWGLVASIQGDLPLSPDWSILVDARYLLGLQDLDTATATTFYTGGFMFMAGVRYSL